MAQARSELKLPEAFSASQKRFVKCFSASLIAEWELALRARRASERPTLRARLSETMVNGAFSLLPVVGRIELPMGRKPMSAHMRDLLQQVEEQPQRVQAVCEVAGLRLAARFEFLLNHCELDVNGELQFAAVCVERVVGYLMSKGGELSVQCVLDGVQLGKPGRKGRFKLSNTKLSHVIGADHKALTAEGAIERAGCVTPDGTHYRPGLSKFKPEKYGFLVVSSEFPAKFQYVTDPYVENQPNANRLRDSCCARLLEEAQVQEYVDREPAEQDVCLVEWVVRRRRGEPTAVLLVGPFNAAVLERADLSNVVACNCELSGPVEMGDCSGVDFRFSVLTRLDFSTNERSLDGTNLSFTEMMECTLDNCKLERVEWELADVSGSSLQGVTREISSSVRLIDTVYTRPGDAMAEFWQHLEARLDENRTQMQLQSSARTGSFVPDIPPASINLDNACVVGSGQFGSVLTGEFNGAEVVLKKLKVSSREALVAFEREATLLGRASRHPCISLLLGMCRMSEGQVYLVMESAGVGDLEEALCKPPSKPLLSAQWEEFGVLVGLLKDVADGLRHMHSQDPPIVHNDVALRNVLVRHENGRNRAKLADLGLACTVEHGKAKRLAPGTRVPKWQMAPETLESREVSPASDVFQFGNLVYEIVTRQRPFQREWQVGDHKAHKADRKAARAAVVENIKQGGRPSWKVVKEVDAFCPGWLLELVDNCCASDPGDRPTMMSVGEQLASYVKEMQGVPREQEALGVHVHNPANKAEAQKPRNVDDGSEVPVHAPEPSSISSWDVDDVCSWLRQLGILSCVELVPLFQKHGIDGELLLDLEVEDLVELNVPRLTIKALFKARAKLPT